MQKINDKLFNWASILDENTLNQAIMTSKMPFIYPHIALMPDAHLGKGATVGSVIPTDRAIIVAAVGGDIGCFRGDTKVSLLDGTQKTMKEMTEKGGKYWVYSLDSDKNIVPGLATAIKTRTNAPLIRLVVSGGEEIFCTPDHKFMMNDGSYKEAQYLKFNDSLMPLYRRWATRDGYESVSTGKGISKQTHIMVYEQTNSKVPRGMVVHHKNHVHFDNRPENLTLMSPSEHSSHHSKLGHKFDNSSKNFQKLRMEGIERRKKDPEKLKQMISIGTKNIIKYMNDKPEHFRKVVAGNGIRGAKYLKIFNTSSRNCKECGKKLNNPAALRWHKEKEHTLSNHKVISIEHLPHREDVYCLTVPEHGNFALSAGVFVHNCGMIAVKTQYKLSDITKPLEKLRQSIERSIPLSKGSYNKVITESAQARLDILQSKAKKDYKQFVGNWKLHLGTLGSGNHFIEVSVDEQDCVWLFLHSGSRGIGNKIAQHHINKAQELCKRWYIHLEDQDLAYLVEGTTEFSDYISDLYWAQEFALLNREEMMDRVIKDFSYFMTGKNGQIQEQERVNCHHNFTVKEKIFSKQVWLSRKGAIEATIGKPGLIPGSMGTASYVIEGKSNYLAFNSAPHGAGRVFSRSQARKTFTIEQLRIAMNGIEYRETDAFLDEIPGAYKDIDQIMLDAADLVTIKHKLRQIVNIKGD